MITAKKQDQRKNHSGNSTENQCDFLKIDLAVITIMMDPSSYRFALEIYADKPEGRTEELWTDWINSCVTAVWEPAVR